MFGIEVADGRVESVGDTVDTEDDPRERCMKCARVPCYIWFRCPDSSLTLDNYEDEQEVKEVEIVSSITVSDKSDRSLRPRILGQFTLHSYT